MNQEIFYDWIRPRIRRLILDTNVSFDGYVCLWDDYLKGRITTDNYCVYQMERLHYKNIFTNEYKRFLDNAEFVFDYSSQNLVYYPRAVHLPLKFDDISEINVVDNNTVLFYGEVSERRGKLLDYLIEQGIKVQILQGYYGKKLVNSLKNFKFVLSYGKYDNRNNDAFRVLPAIENGSIVLCEETEEQWFNKYLMSQCPDRIVFFNGDNIIDKLKGCEK